MRIRIGSAMVAGVCACLLTPGLVHGVTLFSDDFTGGPDPAWGNEAGGWFESGGAYRAGAPNNFPNAHSALPFNLTDFQMTVDLAGIDDGGIWLRSASAAGAIGIEGVLLVFAHNQIYWHNVTGPGYGSSLNSTGFSNPAASLLITVTGNDYSVFIDGSLTPATTLTTASHSSGEVAVYSNSAMTFDNVTVSVDPIPEPSRALLLAAGLIGATGLRRRR